MKYSFFILLMFCYTTKVQSWRPFKIRIVGLYCYSTSSKLAFYNCSLTKLQNSELGLCLDVKLATEVIEPKFNMAITLTRAKQPDFVLINITNYNGCEFFAKQGFPILQIIRKEFAKFSNLPEKCPLYKDTEIIVHNLVLDPENFPPYIPETNYTVNVHLWEDNDRLMDLVVNGTVELKNKYTKSKRKQNSNRRAIWEAPTIRTPKFTLIY